MLWFDVSEIIRKKAAVLTGTERSSLSILRHLTSIRSDVGLLCFDPKTARLCEVPEATVANVGRDSSVAARESSALRFLRKFVGPTRAASKPVLAKPISFTPGDIILSMGSNRSRPGYGAAVAAARAEVPIKCLNLLYDIIPLLFPQWVSEGSAQRFAQWARQQIVNADMLLTISEFQKGEIADFIQQNKLPEKPIEVIYLGDSHFNDRIIRKRPSDAPTAPFVLCVSSLDVRKNHYCLYQVWRRLSAELGDDCPRLVLVGKQISLSQDLIYQMTRDPAVRELIVLRTEGVPDDELGWYYDNCLFTVFPSFYEGWGLPVAESLSHGKLCVASNSSSIPEIGGDLVDYFPPTDIAACYRLVVRALKDTSYRQQREEEIKRQYVPRSWADAAAKISRLADDVAARAPIPVA